jgi:hypothetical protein
MGNGIVMKKRPKRRNWTSEEIQKLEDWMGVYSSKVIASKLKRTHYSVQYKMKHLNLSWKQYQSVRGVLPVDFAQRMGTLPGNVYYWIHKCNLPTVELPKFMTIKNANNSILIDDEKLGEWLEQGWVYMQTIQPTDSYYKILVRNARKKLDIQWISRQDIIDCLNISVKTLQYWQYKLQFPRYEFFITAIGSGKFNRQKVISWAKMNPRYVRPNVIYRLQTAGIAKG